MFRPSLRWAALCISVAAALPFSAIAARSADPLLSLAETKLLTQRVMGRNKDASGWALDVQRSLESNGISARKSNICAVLAVIEQESNFAANPEVKGLGKMAENQIAEKLAALPLFGGLAGKGVTWFLTTHPSPKRSYLKLLRAARTERDLDLVYRNIVYFLFRQYASTVLLNTAPLARRVDRINPVATVGAMQVSVAFAQAEVEKRSGKSLQLGGIWQLRDDLYRRAGGIAFGSRMLLGYYAGYGDRVFVFADFNAGRYASRNAAFQHMVSVLTEKAVALDGDLLIYQSGTPSLAVSATEQALRDLDVGLTDMALRADLLSEKQYGFRDTPTYARVAERYFAKTGKTAPYAMVPQIRLQSPKLSRSMTTERFARAVKVRYERCLSFR